MSQADREARKQAGYIDLSDIADADHKIHPDGSTVELDDGTLIDMNKVPDLIGGGSSSPRK